MSPNEGNVGAAEILGSGRIAVVMTRLRRKIKRPAFLAQRAPVGEGRRG
jgi:hypothetical protein